MNRYKNNVRLNLLMFLLFGLVILSCIPLHREQTEYSPWNLSRSFWLWLHAGAGIALITGCIVHLAWHWDWVRAVFRPSALRKAKQVRRNRFINTGLFILSIFILLSGVWLSLKFGSFVPVDSYHRWNHLHGMSAILMFILLVCHLIMHRKWIETATRRNFDSKQD